MLRAKARRAIFCAAVSTLGLASRTYADVDNWTNPLGGTFSFAGNWNPTAPGATSTAVFAQNATYTVTVTASQTIGQLSFTSGNVQMANNGTARTLTMTGPSGVVVAGGSIGLNGVNLSGPSVAGVASLTIRNGANLSILGGASVTTQALAIGDLGTGGALTVSGTGSSITYTGAAEALVGNVLNGVAALNIQSSASGSFNGTLGVGDSVQQGVNASVNVSGSSQLVLNSLKIGTGGAFSEIGSFTVSSNSTVTQTGASTLSIGAASNSIGTLNLASNAVFNTGTGAINVFAIGFIHNQGAILNVNGPMTFTGGAYQGGFSGSQFNLASNTAALFQGGCSASFMSINLSNPGASVIFTGANTAGALLAPQSVGAAGGAATLSVVNSATISTGNLNVGSGGGGVLNVLSGAGIVSTGVILGGLGLAGDAGTVNLDGASTSFTTGTVVIGNIFGGIGTLNMSGGTLHSTGGFLLQNGSVGVSGGNLQIDGQLNVAGGVFTKSAAATLAFAPASTGILINNSGICTIDGGLQTNTGGNISASLNSQLNVHGGSLVISGSSLSLFTGADADVDTLLIGAGSANGVATFDGNGTTLNSTNELIVGENGRAGSLTFTNNASATVFSVEAGDTFTQNSAGTIVITGGASLSADSNVFIAGLATTGTRGVLSISNGLLHQTAGNVHVGASSGSVGSVTIGIGGQLDTGSGGMIVSSTGTVDLAGGTLNLNGAPLTIDGGVVKRTSFSGSLNLGSGGAFMIQNGGAAFLNGQLLVINGAFQVTGSGSQLQIPGNQLVLFANSVGTISNAGSVALAGLTLANSGTSTLTVNGASLSIPNGGAAFVGINSGNGTLSLLNSSTGSISTLVAGAGIGLSKGTVVVTDSALSLGSMQIGANTFPGSTGEMDLLGLNPSVTLNGPSTTGASSGSAGTLSIGAGTFTNNSQITVSPTGTILINGGRFVNNGGVALQGGKLIVSSGLFDFPASGSLSIVGGGAATFSTGFTPGGFVLLNQNNSVLHLPNGAFIPAGGVITVQPGASVDCTSQLVLQGGVININGGAVSTNTLGADAFGPGGTVNFNSGTLNFTAGYEFNFLNLNPIFGNNATLLAGRTLNVTNAATFDTGFTVDGGTLSVGSIGGGGNLLTLKNGALNINSALNIQTGGPLGTILNIGPGMAINASSIFVGAPTKVVISGGTLSSTGNIIISTFGELKLDSPTALLTTTATINNSGLIHGTGMLLAGNVANLAGGVIRASTGEQTTVNLLDNSGTISLLGGAVNSLQFITNEPTGHITGRGTLVAPTGLSNAGTTTLSAGLSDIIGPTTNSGTIIVTGGGTATFNDNLTNGSLSTFRVSSDSAAVFLGNVTGLAAFTGNGKKYFEGAASSGPIVTLGASIVGGDSSLTADAIREDSLTVIGIAKVNANGTSVGASHLHTLTIDGTLNNWDGKLDLTNNALVLDYDGESPLPTVMNQIISGFHNGDWHGNGITSTLASNTAPHPTAIGYAEAGTLGATSLLGQPADNTSVLMRYVFTGDANLDGVVNALDFNALASNFGNGTGKIWTTGDFNYDGTSNTLDFNAIAINFNQALPGPALGTFVPEPSFVVPLLLLTCRLKRARRRVSDRRLT